MANPPAAQKDDWERALEGIEFPISGVALSRTVRDRGGLDHEVLTVTDRLTDGEFETRDELLAAIREAYTTDGFDSPI